MSFMKMQNVTFYYNSKFPVLQDLNLELSLGKVYAILGPSGCGKTTLLSLLGGLDVPVRGEILYEGKNIQSKGLEIHRRNHVAFIFQNYNLINYMTPEENVLLTAKEPPIPVLNCLGLSSEEIKRNVMRLSGGQQQRVAIARALASGAPLILADEPTGNLDEYTSEEIVNILCENARLRNRCVVIVTHSKQVAAKADIVYWLKNGKISIEKED